MSENVTDDEFDEVGQMDAEDYGELKQAYDALLAERDALREAGDALACSLTAFHDVGTPHADCSPCEALSAWRAATGEGT